MYGFKIWLYIDNIKNAKIAYTGFVILIRQMIEGFIENIKVDREKKIDIHWTFCEEEYLV